MQSPLFILEFSNDQPQRGWPCIAMGETHGKVRSTVVGETHGKVRSTVVGETREQVHNTDGRETESDIVKKKNQIRYGRHCLPY